MRTPPVSGMIWLVASLALLHLPSSDAPAQTAPQTPNVSANEAREIARDAYIYAYPMVLTEITRRVMTNVERPEGLRSPMNQIAHTRTFPSPSVTDVVRPNADVLHSVMFLDVSKEPMVITVPDSQGRYYLLAMLDIWTDVFASRGKRASGTTAHTFTIVGPRWQGRLPNGVSAIRSPTAVAVLAGGTQVNGKADLPAVQKFQNGIKAVPLSRYGKPHMSPKGKLNPQQDMSAPPDQVERMDAATFYALFADLMKENPPRASDYPILERMKRIGIEPGKAFSLAAAPHEVQRGVQAAPQEALRLINAAFAAAHASSNGWRTDLAAVASNGADHLHRAGFAFARLGANVVVDAVHPAALADADGRPLSSDKSYVLHFGKDQIPPVQGFWSLTMYNDKHLLAANPINRYTVGDRDKLQFNIDDSLTLYIQRDSPGTDKESNWLPTPAAGSFTMNLRLYWPKPEALTGKWSPPPVRLRESVGARALQ